MRAAALFSLLVIATPSSSSARVTARPSHIQARVIAATPRALAPTRSYRHQLRLTGTIARCVPTDLPPRRFELRAHVTPRGRVDRIEWSPDTPAWSACVAERLAARRLFAQLEAGGEVTIELNVYPEPRPWPGM